MARLSFMRVDTIPAIIRPVYLLLSGVACGLSYLLLFLVRLTLRVRFTGEGVSLLHKQVILCSWHENGIAYVLAFLRHPRRFVWLNHPLWYMKPVHQLLWLMGIRKLVLGSTGNSGKEGVETLVRYLKSGYSTSINPDGPAGPPRKIKKGVVFLSQKSGVPVLPLRFEMDHSITLGWTWDRKRIPLPFSCVNVVCGEPVTFQAKGAVDETRILAARL